MRIGIEFGGTHIKMGIVSDDGIVVRYNEKKLADLTDSEGIVQSLKQAVYDFIGDEKIEKGGISAKGLVDTDKGQVIDDVGAGRLLIGVPLCEIFSKNTMFHFRWIMMPGVTLGANGNLDKEKVPRYLPV